MLRRWKLFMMMIFVMMLFRFVRVIRVVVVRFLFVFIIIIISRRLCWRRERCWKRWERKRVSEEFLSWNLLKRRFFNNSLLFIDRQRIRWITRLIIWVSLLITSIFLRITLIIVIEIAFFVVILIAILLIANIVVLIDWRIIVWLLKRRKRWRLSLLFRKCFFNIITFSDTLHFFQLLYEVENRCWMTWLCDVSLKVKIKVISCSIELLKYDDELGVFAMTNNALHINGNLTLTSYVFNDISIHSEKNHSVCLVHFEAFE